MVTQVAKVSSGLKEGQHKPKKLASAQIKYLFNTLANFQSNRKTNNYFMQNYKTDAKLLLTALDIKGPIHEMLCDLRKHSEIFPFVIL